MLNPNSMFFKLFQKISNAYWRKIDKIIPTFSIVFIFSLLIIPIYLPEALKNSYRDFSKIADLVYVIITFFGLGSALIGSLSIQYSLTKIIARYRYLDLLIINILIITFRYLTDFYYLDYMSLIPLFFLFIHTVFLIDKIYDPEEIITDVIAPMILQFENASIDAKISEGKSETSSLYGIIESAKEKKLYPLFSNTKSDLLSISNAETSSFGKAISRLTKSHSLKTEHLVYNIIEKITEENYYLKFHKKYTGKVDAFSFQWFLLVYVLYHIRVLAKENKEYEHQFQNLLIIFHSIILTVENNPKKIFGELNSGTREDILVLRNKEGILSMYERWADQGHVLLHDNAYEQIFDTVTGLMMDFINQNCLSIINKGELTVQEEDNLFALIKLALALLDKIKDKKLKTESIFISVFCEMIIFIRTVEDPISLSKKIDIIRSYFKAIFANEDVEIREQFLKKTRDKIRSKNEMIVFNKRANRYHEKYCETIKNLGLGSAFDKETVDSLGKIKAEFFVSTSASPPTPASEQQKPMGE